MELGYTSVTQFYVDLKAHLLSKGLTVARTVTPETDLVFDLGGGSGFFRLKRVTGPSTMAVGWKFGTDADVLAVESWDAERQMPFAATPDAEFVPTFNWDEDRRQMAFCIVGNNDGETRGSRYRVIIDLSKKEDTVRHEDRFRPNLEPNFKDNGGAFIPAGA